MPGGLDLIAAYRPAPYNLLVNPGYEIWQRGTSSSSSGILLADMWNQEISVSTFTVSRITSTIGSKGYSLQVAYTHGTNGFSNIFQKVERSQLLGKTLTFSAKVKSNTVGVAALWWWDGTTYTFTPRNTTTGEETLYLPLTIPTSATGFMVGLSVGVATATVEINDATLVVGPYPAPYVPLTPEEDLSRCKRYYWTVGGSDAVELICPMQCYSTTQALGDIRFPVEMAVTPTVTVTNPTNFACLTAAGVSQACTAVSGSVITKTHARLNATTASGLVAGNATILHANSSTSLLIAFEANP